MLEINDDLTRGIAHIPTGTIDKTKKFPQLFCCFEFSLLVNKNSTRTNETFFAFFLREFFREQQRIRTTNRNWRVWRGEVPTTQLNVRGTPFDGFYSARDLLADVCDINHLVSPRLSLPLISCQTLSIFFLLTLARADGKPSAHPREYYQLSWIQEGRKGARPLKR